MKQPEEPNLLPSVGPALSFEGRYTALPKQQGGDVHEEDADADDLGAWVLVVGTEAERHDREREVLPEELVVQPEELEEPTD
jgi:hypothetical protein